MYILEVAVFNTIKELSILSYFGDNNTDIGDMIEITLDKRKTTGIILNKSSISENKEKIRQGDFKLRKIDKIVNKNFIDKDFIKSLSYISSVQGVSITKCIEKLLPKLSLEILNSLTSNNNNIYKETADNIDINNYKNNNRYKNTKDKINKSIEDKTNNKDKTDNKENTDNGNKTNNNNNQDNTNNIVIFTPTILENIQLTKNLNTYFENNNLKINIINFHSELSEKQKQNIIEKINLTNIIKNQKANIKQEFIDKKHTKDIYENTVFIFTPSLLPLVLPNIKHIYWTNSFSKYYDNWHNINTKVILSHLIDNYFNIEQSFLSDDNNITIEEEYAMFYNKIFNKKLNINIISPDYDNTNLTFDNGDFIFSNQIKNAIKNKIKNNENIILYTTKNSDNPISVCKSCGNIVKCHICNSPMSLHIQRSGNRFYFCKACNIKVPIKSLQHENQKDMNTVLYESFDTCNNCGSFEIVSMGISTKQIYQQLLKPAIQKEFNITNPDQQILLLDDNNISIRKRLNIYNQFKTQITMGNNLYPNTSNPKFLIINESAINFLQDEDNIFILSLDTLFFIKNYEKDIFILNTLLNLNNKIKTNHNIINNININNKYIKNTNQNNTIDNTQEIKLFLQTRQKSNKEIKNILDKIQQNTICKIYEDELEERCKRLLPPYSYIVSFTLINTLADIPNILKPYKYFIIKNKSDNNKVNIIKSNNKNSNLTTYLYKYIFLIPKDIWENDDKIRNFINQNFASSTLTVGNIDIF